jgi:hypothetical protein
MCNQEFRYICSVDDVENMEQSSVMSDLPVFVQFRRRAETRKYLKEIVGGPSVPTLSYRRA